MILCLGDSITLGMVGYSYVDFLDPAVIAVNKGVNGDTTVCAYKRLQKYISEPQYEQVDTCVVFIGTNDILLPYLASLPGLWKTRYKFRVKLKKCILDDSDFAREYEKYLKLLFSHHKRVITVGIPYSQLKGYPLDTIRNRNEIIKSLAEKYHADYIDVFSMQEGILGESNLVYSWKSKIFVRLFDIFTMLVLPFTKDWFSSARSLKVTVDGIHFSSESAKALSDAVEDLLGAQGC